MHNIKLPSMRRVNQHFLVPSRIEAETELERQWEHICPEFGPLQGKRLAVGVGSRGIANLPLVVRRVVTKLRQAEAEPFIIPAMGSHGGATAEGQTEVLRALGITEQEVGAPIRSCMETVVMGEADGIPLFLDRIAFEADGLVLINRIKPHTNFFGVTESGIMKMMAIGLGNQTGAEHYHRLSLIHDQYTIISTAGRELIRRSNLLFGVCLVENQDHETCDLVLASAKDIQRVENRLLKKARSILPTLPLNEIDVLIVDEMGKDISGEGIDPNVVGRDVCSYGVERPLPEISRIYVRDLTFASKGSAVGIGQADFTTNSLLDKVDLQITAANCLTACAPELGKIPLAYPNDYEAIRAMCMTIRPFTRDDLRLVHIKNTLNLKTLFVSRGCLDHLKDDQDLKVDPDDFQYEFDQTGNLQIPYPLN